MTRKGNNRVSFFSPHINEMPTISFVLSFDHSHKQTHRKNIASPKRLFRCVRTNVEKVVRYVTKRRPSTKSPSVTVAPQRFVPHRDSHQSENLEDCIEFINSSYRRSI